MLRSWTRVLSWLVALLAGAIYGAAGTIAHAYRLGWFPLGLLLAIIGTGALLVAARALTRDRWTALAAGLGTMAAVLVFSGRGPGGSVIVPDGELDSIGPVNLGMVWTIAVPVLVAIVVAWPDLRRLRETAAH